MSKLEEFAGWPGDGPFHNERKATLAVEQVGAVLQEIYGFLPDIVLIVREPGLEAGQARTLAGFSGASRPIAHRLLQDMLERALGMHLHHKSTGQTRVLRRKDNA